jgi:hypothetical protein
MSEHLVIGDLEFEVDRSARRRSVEMTVDRDGQLRLRAPKELGSADLTKIVAGRRLWVYKTLAAKKLLAHPYMPKEYVPCEGLYYLGRSYRLRLEDSADRLTLRDGRFVLPRSASPKGRAAFVGWYSRRAADRLAQMVRRTAPRIGVTPKRVAVRDVGSRWASCGKDGTLYFHWRVVLLPVRAYEYLVLHELAHLREPLHTAAFWRLVGRAMPDWEQRKNWLARNGSKFDL